MKINRLVCLILVIMFICGLSTGCYDRREVDDLGYIIALGIDKGKTNYLKMTFQIAKPEAGGGGGESGGGGSSEEKGYSMMTIEAPTVYSGLNMVNTFTSKQLNMSHNKVIVISKELARAGIEPYLHAFLRGREFRPNMYIVVARDSAEDYLKNVKPELVLSPAKFYELVYRAYSYTGFIPNVQFHDFYNYSEGLYRQPVAILGGVGKFKSSEEFNIEKSTYRKKGRKTPFGGDFLAGDVTKAGGADVENMGLAVFDGDRMVGELDGEDVKYFLMATGEYGHAYWTIPDPKVKDRFVLLDIKQSRKPRHRVELGGGKPKTYTKINLEADILSIQSTIDYEQDPMLKVFEAYVENFIRKEMLGFLQVTSKTFKSDICGFGAYAKRYFLTWKEWEDYNWKSRYRNASFNVDVNFKIRRPGLLIRTLPSVSSAGREEVE